MCCPAECATTASSSESRKRVSKPWKNREMFFQGLEPLRRLGAFELSRVAVCFPSIGPEVFRKCFLYSRKEAPPAGAAKMQRKSSKAWKFREWRRHLAASKRLEASSTFPIPGKFIPTSICFRIRPPRRGNTSRRRPACNYRKLSELGISRQSAFGSLQFHESPGWGSPLL